MKKRRKNLNMCSIIDKLSTNHNYVDSRNIYLTLFIRLKFFDCIICNKDGLRSDNLLTRCILFLSGFYYVKKQTVQERFSLLFKSSERNLY